MDKFICKDEEENSYVIHFSFDPSYQKFYKWINTIKLKDNHNDFPRDYIVLSKTDEAIMFEKFGII